MLDLKSNKSLILSLGNLKLSDTEYTLNKDKMINGIHYKPIFQLMHVMVKILLFMNAMIIYLKI